ncbi:MAG: hypothetical protein JWN86_834 [Planctomycetota bacterium]|nr:hypothetical protein [Planctomycetota bacterium]
MNGSYPHRDEEMPEATAARISAELAPGERLTWAGRSHLRVPDFARWLLAGPILLAMGGWLFAQIDFAGNQGQAAFSGMTVMLLLGVVIAWAAGFILSLGSLFRLTSARAVRRLNAGALHALTDRRAIIWRPAPGSSGTEVRSFTLDEIVRTTRIERPDGTGDVLFTLIEGAAPGSLDVTLIQTMPAMSGAGFFGITDPRRVEELIRQSSIRSRDFASQ